MGKQNICAYSWSSLILFVQITMGMSEQRSTDLGALKHEGLKYLTVTQEPPNPPLGKGQDKSGRGFNHPEIAHQLCPCKKLDIFDEDPDWYVDILTHVIAYSLQYDGCTSRGHNQHICCQLAHLFL